MYEHIKSLQPYFYSLREINDSVSLDIKLPVAWKHDTIVFPYKGIKSQVQDKNDKFNLVSLISRATKEGYSMVLTCALEIITINKEEEEKRKLFDQKVNELKLLFQNKSLDKLKDLNFLEEDGQQDTTSLRMVEQGDGEGQVGNTEEQREID